MNQPQKRQNGTLDAQTDHVLAHLNSAQPPAGLNQRLLQRLGQVAHSEQIAHSEQVAHSQQIVISTEGAAAVERPAVSSEAYAAPSSANTRLRPALAPQAKFLWPLALSCAIAAILATLAFQPRHPLNPARPSNTQNSEGAAAPNLATQLSPNPPQEGPEPPKVKLFSANQPFPSGQPSVPPPNPSQAPHSVTVAAQNPTPQTPEEAKALDDFQAPSQPAPPLPLTAQERVLVRMLRRGSSIELAQLAPDWLNAFSNREKADFENFFDPPPLPQLDKPENSPLPNLLPPTPLVSSPSPSSPQLGEQSK